jgi:hypothetical protein
LHGKCIQIRHIIIINITHNNALGFDHYNTTRPKFSTTTKLWGTMRDAAMLMPVGRPLMDAATICI